MPDGATGTGSSLSEAGSAQPSYSPAWVLFAGSGFKEVADLPDRESANAYNLLGLSSSSTTESGRIAWHSTGVAVDSPKVRTATQAMLDDAAALRSPGIASAHSGFLLRPPGYAAASWPARNVLAAEGDFAREVLRVVGVDIGELADEVTADVRTTAHRADPLDQVLDRAVARARELGHGYVGSEHLLLSLVGAAPDELVARALRVQGVRAFDAGARGRLHARRVAFARSSGALASKSV